MLLLWLQSKIKQVILFMIFNPLCRPSTTDMTPASHEFEASSGRHGLEIDAYSKPYE
jgi:hypothetical protein